MIEEIWFLAIMWFILLVLTFTKRKAFLGGFSAMFTFFFGYELTINLTEHGWLGVFMLFFGFYLLYVTLFQLIKGKEEGKK